MKSGSIIFLKLVVGLIALAVLVFCVLGLIPAIFSAETGYYRPLFIGMLVPAVPFYMALYQTWNLLSYLGSDKAFSNLSVTALKNIKYSAAAIGVMYALGMPYIFYAADRDDAPGVVLIGLIIIFASFVIAVFAAVLETVLQNALEIKSDNDLTV